MPKHIPETVKLEAMSLFLEGDKTAKEIASVISRDGVVVKPPTIYAWAKKERWGEIKTIQQHEANTALVETEGQRLARITREQLAGYTALATKGSEELQGLHFDRALDAAKAMDMGIRGAREIEKGLIETGFVNAVMAVLVEELGAEQGELLARIAIKLKSVAVEFGG